MSFLRKLFGGGSDQGGNTEGMYFYVRALRTGEVIQIRIHRINDLSMTDDQQGYYVRKVAVGRRSFDRIEMEAHFDKNRKFLSADVQGGELVEREDYDAFLSAQAGDQTGEQES
ncbi:MAG: hypothetical protein JXQ72_05180 [Anaerolineae bacterium]|nr:hypothetical protein [Anaerolineae bacterium]